MADCVFTLNGELFSRFSYLAGSCIAFSGNGTDRNNAASGGIPDGGPIPPGSYHIVDRESGGLMSYVKAKWLHRDRWFALYRDDGSVDDETFVDGVRRGEFRLHPLGPRRMSTGCIVVQYAEEFDRLRDFLLSQPVAFVPDTNRRSYGLVSVMGASAPTDGVAPGRVRYA